MQTSGAKTAPMCGTSAGEKTTTAAAAAQSTLTRYLSDTPDCPDRASNSALHSAYCASARPNSKLCGMQWAELLVEGGGDGPDAVKLHIKLQYSYCFNLLPQWPERLVEGGGNETWGRNLHSPPT